MSQDYLDEWSNWRGRLVHRQHHTYCDHDHGACTPTFDSKQYVIAGGNAARAIRRTVTGLKNRDEYLVLIPITQDTDDDSFELVKREDIFA